MHIAPTVLSGAYGPSIVDGLGDDDAVRVGDPFDGTPYRMKTDDFPSYWTWAAVWQASSPGEEA